MEGVTSNHTWVDASSTRTICLSSWGGDLSMMLCTVRSSADQPSLWKHTTTLQLFFVSQIFLAIQKIFSPGGGQLGQGQVAALGPAPGVAVVGQGAVEGDEVADVLGQSEMSTVVT